MKKIIITMMALALIVGVGVMKAEAATSDTITITVTLQSVSVAVSPGTWAIGNVVASSFNTLDCTATNGGNVNQDLTIAVSNSVDWTVGTAGADTFAMDFSLDANIGPWTNIPSTTSVSLVAAVVPGDQAFYLRLTAPSSSLVQSEQTITLTVSASPA